MVLDLTHRKNVEIEKEVPKPKFKTKDSTVEVFREIRSILELNVGNSVRLRDVLYKLNLWFAVETYRNCKGNMAMTARMLGYKRSTLVELFKANDVLEIARDPTVKLFEDV